MYPLALTARRPRPAAARRPRLALESLDGRHEPVLTIKKDKSGYKGEYVEGDQKLTAKDLRFRDGKLRFTIESEYEGKPATTTFEGEVTGNAIKGECNWEYQGMSGSFPFTGKREAAGR